MDAPENRRWYYPTPRWLVLGSLAVTGLLFLSEKGRWFPFNVHKGWTVLMAVAGVGVVLFVMLLWWLVAVVLRWRFQFGIHALLVLAVAVALPFSWLAVEMRRAKLQRKLVEAILTIHATEPGTLAASLDSHVRLRSVYSLSRPPVARNGEPAQAVRQGLRGQCCQAEYSPVTHPYCLALRREYASAS